MDKARKLNPLQAVPKIAVTIYKEGRKRANSADVLSQVQTGKLANLFAALCNTGRSRATA
jgi:hypothetical protein